MASRIGSYLLTAVFGLLSVGAYAQTDVSGSVQDPEIEALIESRCGKADPDCRRTLMKLLSSLQLGPIDVQAGLNLQGELSRETQDQILFFSTRGVELDAMGGDLRALTFEAVKLSEEEGLRIRFNLAEGDVLFICTDQETGKKYPPLLGLLQSCRPDETIGIGAKVLEYQRDLESGREAMRWLELNAVYNFLKNGNGFKYLQKRLSAFAGFSGETVWTHDSHLMPKQTESGVRMNIGIMGMLRSRNNRWELRGMAGYRPNVTDFDDWGIEARAQAIRHVLVSKGVLGSIILDGSYSRWSNPALSIGPFASDRHEETRTIGAMFGIRF